MKSEPKEVTFTGAAVAAIPAEAAAVEQQAMNPTAANDAVTQEVSSWEGVIVQEHRFGGVEFRVGRRELGHLHARFADLPFPRTVRDELILAGRARPHHVLPQSGWVTVPMRTKAEVKNVIMLFRQNYDRRVKPEP